MSFAQQIIDGHIEFAPKNRLTESKGRESFHNLRYYAEPYLDCQKIFVYSYDFVITLLLLMTLITLAKYGKETTDFIRISSSEDCRI